MVGSKYLGHDIMKNKELSISIKNESPDKMNNELHLTGDLLASGEDSLRYAPDFSLDDKSLNSTRLRNKPSSQPEKSANDL